MTQRLIQCIASRHYAPCRCHNIGGIPKKCLRNQIRTSHSRKTLVFRDEHAKALNFLRNAHLDVSEYAGTSRNGTKSIPSHDAHDTPTSHFSDAFPETDAEIQLFIQSAMQKHSELKALLQKSLYLEFLKELLHFHALNLEMCISVEDRRALYEQFLETIPPETLTTIINYRSDLFLQNRTMLFYLITYIWREKRRDLRDAFFTKEVDYYLSNNRICVLLRKSSEDVRELMRRKLLTPKVNTGDHQNFQDVDLMDFLENPDFAGEAPSAGAEGSFRDIPNEEEEEENADAAPKKKRRTAASRNAGASTSTPTSQASTTDDSPFASQMEAALIEHTQFELQLMHRLCLFYLDAEQYETAYNIMRINCTPIDPTNQLHLKVWSHFYANLVRFTFMGGQVVKVGFRFREKRAPPTKEELRLVTHIVCQPFTHKDISLNALMDDIFYQVVVMELCGLSNNAELATAFFVDHVLPYLQHADANNIPIPMEREKRVMTGLFRSLYFSDNWMRVTTIYEHLFADPDVRPCQLYDTSYRYIIQSYARLGEYEKMKALFAKVRKELPDFDSTEVMHAVMEGFLETGKTKALYRMFQEMYVGRYGDTPSASVINVLIQALIKDQKLSAAVKVFEQYFTTPVARISGNVKMFKPSILPMQSRTVSILLHGMFEAQQPEAVVKFLQPLTKWTTWKKGTNMTPIISAILTHMKEFPEHRDQLISVVAPFREMKVKHVAEEPRAKRR